MPLSLFCAALFFAFEASLAVEGQVSEDFPPARGQGLMQTGYAVPPLQKSTLGVKLLELTESNELGEALLLAESTEKLAEAADFDLMEAVSARNLETLEVSRISFNGIAAALTLGIAALLPDILAFASALLGFKILAMLLGLKLKAHAEQTIEDEKAEHETEDEQGLDLPRFLPCEEVDDSGCTALHVAAHSGLVDKVTELLQARADPNAREAWGETPLHMAARTGCPKTVNALVKAGAALQAVNADEKTALMVAGHFGNEEACDVLLGHGAGVGGVSEDDLPPLLTSLILRRLLHDGAQEGQAKQEHED